MNTLASQLMGSGPVLPLAAPRVSLITRWTIGVLGLVVVVSASIGLSRIANDPLRFPVTNVDVLGTLDYEDRDVLKNLIEAHTENGFYGLDIDRVRDTLTSLQWVAHARVSRVWPGRISVEVEEHEPAARWNDDSLISKRHVLFVPPQLKNDDKRYKQWHEVFSPLPQLRGSEGRYNILMDSYRAYQQQLARFNVTLTMLDEDERRSQTLQLSNNVTVRLGYEERELRMSRFMDVYERLAPQFNGRTARFDMRYSNGFALQADLNSEHGAVQ